jgi:hypothetical protein
VNGAPGMARHPFLNTKLLFRILSLPGAKGGFFICPWTLWPSQKDRKKTAQRTGVLAARLNYNKMGQFDLDR